METMTTTAYPTSPQPRNATVRSSHSLRNTQAEGYAPASQDSQSTALSDGVGSVAPRLQTGSSNLSQLSSHTDLTSPTSSASNKTSQDATRVPARLQIRTPEEQAVPSYFERENALASPMSIASPVTVNGTKRTASGHVKNAASLSGTPYTSAFASSGPRRDSISSTSSKAGELAASLKARLGYAMAKVHNGWEHKSLEEVEQLAVRRASRHRHSVSFVKQPAVTSGVNSSSLGLLSSNAGSCSATEQVTSPPSKRHSANYSHHRRGLSLGQHTQLQPSADIRPTSSSRAYLPPHSLNYANYGTSMSPPRTPINDHPRRPPTIRTETQTAADEQDALQALSQLASPRTSNMSALHYTPSQANSSQASPLRSEFTTPRRVEFARSDSGSSGELLGPSARAAGHFERG